MSGATCSSQMETEPSTSDNITESVVRNNTHTQRFTDKTSQKRKTNPTNESHKKITPKHLEMSNKNKTTEDINKMDLNVVEVEVQDHTYSKKQKTEINKYTRLDTGPYKIIVTKDNINMIHLAKALKINKMNANNMEKISKNMARMEFKTYIEANDCVQSEAINLFDGYKMFIPYNFNKTIGVIKNVPIEITDEEILENINSDIPIEKIERMTKWNPTTETASNMELVKITFKGNNLPNNVVLYDNILAKVSYYIPNPLLCKGCLNYGHTAKKCNSKGTIRCHTCAKIKDEDHLCDLRPNCKHCGEGHRTNNRDCRERIRQKQITEYMTINKTNYRETKETLYGLKQKTPQQVDFMRDGRNHPTQEKTIQNIKQNDNRQQIMNNIFAKLKQDIKHKNELLKHIEQTLQQTTEVAKNPAYIDDLIIRIGRILTAPPIELE